MKKRTLLASLLIAAGISTAVNANPTVAGNANQQFVWKGLVPVEETDGDSLKIVQAGSVPFDSGAIQFLNTKGLISVKSASEMAFKVLTDTNTVPTTKLYYTMVEKTVIRDGRDASELTPAFNLASGSTTIAPLLLDVSKEIPAPAEGATTAEIIKLKIEAGNDLSRIRAGDSIGVSAFIEVSTAAL